MRKSVSETVSRGGTAGISELFGIFKAVVFSYAVSLAAFLPTAYVAANRCFSDKAIGLCAKLVCALGTMICGFLSGRFSEKGGLAAGAISGTVYTSVLWIMGGILSRTVSFGAECAAALVVGVVCGSVGGIVGINSKVAKRGQR